jgi:N-glycosidase YbiA
MKSTVITFTSVKLPFGWLGNMSPYPINYDGKIWRTTEALFQALRFESDEIREIIRNEKSPMAAKMMAKKFKSEMVVVPMSETDVNNMRLCLRLKYEQHSEIQLLLKATENKIIIEDIGNRKGERHKFWGVKWNGAEWEGQNKMGKLWMELREEMKLN